MGKGANQQLLSNAGQGQQQQQSLSGSGSKISSFLTPQLETEATNPQGYTPQQLAYMNTASQQSEGGSVGGATGQANLTAARTRNAGGYQGAIASSARSAQKSLSQNALSIQQQQAQLQQQQRQQALDSLQKLYGVDEQTALGYLNQSDTALNQENQSHPNQQGLNTASTFISALEGNKGCWIAAAVYDGWEDPRTIDVRRWLNTEFKKTLTGRVVMAAYMAIGRQVAWFVRRSSLLKRAFKPLFDLALEKARA